MARAHPSFFGDKTKALAGRHAIQEVLGDVSFELSARAFFQLNPEQTVKLYDEVKQAAQLTGKEKVVDAYCGVGTIGMWVSSGAKEIRGMDVIKESIDDAKKNAKKTRHQKRGICHGNSRTLAPEMDERRLPSRRGHRRPAANGL